MARLTSVTILGVRQSSTVRDAKPRSDALLPRPEINKLHDDVELPNYHPVVIEVARGRVQLGGHLGGDCRESSVVDRFSIDRKSRSGPIATSL